MLQTDSIGTLDVSSLAKRCAAETGKFLQRIAGDTQYCYELFRRALVLQNQDAYDAIFKTYMHFVAPRIRKKLHSPFSDQDVEECVNLAFANCFRRLAMPEVFANFPTLEQVIGYLLCCANSAAQTYNRKQAARPATIAIDRPEAEGIDPRVDPLSFFIDEERKKKFRTLVMENCRNEQERVVFEYYIELGLMPRQIYAQRPELFADVKQVHRVKQILLERLQRLLEQHKEDLL